MRSMGLDASSASVIEAVRLADALAACAASPPGLGEINEALLTVLCHGDASPAADPAPAGNRRRHRQRAGAQPDGALQRDLEAEQKRLR